MLRAKLDVKMTKHFINGPTSRLHELIKAPAHLLDSSSSCIDLIFTSPPNLVMDMVFTKFDLSIYYPPPFERTVWYYNRANADLIQRAIDLFNWDKALRINDVDKQVAIFTYTLINIMQKFVPNETIICDDRDHYPWMNKEIKQLNRKNKFPNDSFKLIKLYFISISVKHSRTN